MAAPKDVVVKLTIDTSGFVEGMKQAAEAVGEFQRSIGESLLSPLRTLAAELAEWFRVQASRDTYQVPCTEDHEVVFLGTEGGLDRPCPGCGAAL